MLYNTCVLPISKILLIGKTHELYNVHPLFNDQGIFNLFTCIEDTHRLKEEHEDGHCKIVKDIQPKK